MSDTSPATDAESMALLGPVLLGASAHLLLVGILLCSFTHHLTSPGPSWSSTSRRLKRVIVFVVGLTTFIAALHINDILHFGTLQSRDASSLLRGTKIEAVEPVLVGVVGSVVHSVLVYRASRIMRIEWHRWLLLCSAGLLISSSFLGSLGTTIWGLLYYQNPWLESSFSPTFNNCVVIWLLCSACTDTIITITYIVQLHSRLAGFNPTTDSALKMIINTSIRSAAYTTVIAVPGAIISLVYNGDDLMTCDIAYAFFLPLPACYALSLFTTLSVPDKLQSHRSSGVIGSFPQTTQIPTRISFNVDAGAQSTLGADLRCPYDDSEDHRRSVTSVAFDSNTRFFDLSSKRAYRSRSITSLRSLPSLLPSPRSSEPLPLGSLSAIDGVQVHVQLHVEEDRIGDEEYEEFELGQQRLMGTRLEVQPGGAGPGLRVQKGVVASGGARGIRR